MKDVFLGLTLAAGLIALIDIAILIFIERPDGYFADKIIFFVCLGTYAILRNLEKRKN